MGVVYAAYDTDLERKVAIKLLNPARGESGDRDQRKRHLIEEAKKIAKVGHPNVISVFETGSFSDQVFVAMEYAGGGTLRDWLTQRRGWREVVIKFLEAGRGLAAAHREEIVHRDFKPANVLIGKDGRARVVDFGLSRTNTADPDGAAESHAIGRGPTDLGKAQVYESLTRPGGIVGTPAYMAPEVFLGNKADPKSDQFSYCVALYEALYGIRPFDGHDIYSIGASTILGELQPPPASTEVPSWVHRILLRGLSGDPASRFPALSDLLDALAADPLVQRRRRAVRAGVVAAFAVTVLASWQYVAAKRRDVERKVAAYITEAAERRGKALGHDGVARRLRASAFDTFAARRKDDGEELWQKSLTEIALADGDLRRATQLIEAAFALHPDASVHQLLSEILVERASLADRDHRSDDRDAALAALQKMDPAAVARWQQPARLTIESTPGANRVSIERFEPAPNVPYGRSPVTELALSAPAGLSLPAGSYLLTFTGAGRAETRYPVLLGRGEAATVRVEMPELQSVPAGFVFVPHGSFLFGSADESLRTEFLGTTPLRPVETGAFLIAKQETTYAAYIMFLRSLPPSLRRQRMPRTGSPLWGHLELRRTGGTWHLTLQPTKEKYQARAGEPIVYAGRQANARQDWMLLPVTGISAADARAYAAWLSATGRVRGARLCNELEWERAARGADAREFPHGDTLALDHANFDLTYGRRSGSFGPDEVGAHPASRSPFGVDDMAGNVMEHVESSLAADEVVLRGGGYYFTARSARSTNRFVVEPSTRFIEAGIRICADAPRGAVASEPSSR
jgi:formylglycine-generating enzyme required for sulfatase activity